MISVLNRSHLFLIFSSKFNLPIDSFSSLHLIMLIVKDKYNLLERLTGYEKILIIEDENNLARFIELELKHEGFEVAVAHEGRNGLELALEKNWDIILLDLMLPELNGIEICRRIRKVKQTPIIILTARDSVMDRVSGLDSGADDYLTKPFAIEELLARIRALLRRFEQISNENKHLVWKDIEIDLDSRIVKKRDK